MCWVLRCWTLPVIMTSCLLCHLGFVFHRGAGACHYSEEGAFCLRPRHTDNECSAHWKMKCVWIVRSGFARCLGMWVRRSDMRGCSVCTTLASCVVMLMWGPIRLMQVEGSVHGLLVLNCTLSFNMRSNSSSTAAIFRWLQLLLSTHP